MQSGAQKLLESATQRTLHAQNFSRTSSQASCVLTDLVSRYLQLLASTCGKYAEHAGRRRLSSRDVVSSLAELGLSLSELEDYLKDEAYELGRYAIRSFRGIEDLNEYRAHLQHGLKLDKDDVQSLEYKEYHPNDDGDDGDEEEEEIVELETPPPSPPRKRPRTLDWEPPDHIPDFLPPFPTADPPKFPLIVPKVELPASPIPQTNPTVNAIALSESAPDISTRVPYSQSSLSQVPEWHLPEQEPATVMPSKENVLPTPQVDPSLTGAYLHILKNPPSPTLPPANPSRHRVAMNLLGVTQTASRWDVADTLYANVAPNLPRVAPTGPTYAVPVGALPFIDTKKGPPPEKLPPGVPPRTIGGNAILANNVAAQGSRIPELARCVLPNQIYSRISRLGHPPVLTQGAKQLTYGPSVPAPWNSSEPVAPLKGINGFGKAESEKPALPDARLYATWDYESKDYRVPLHVPNKLNITRNRLGSQTPSRRDSVKERPKITLRGVNRA